jgi:hypothetical protein
VVDFMLSVEDGWEAGVGDAAVVVGSVFMLTGCSCWNLRISASFLWWLSSSWRVRSALGYPSVRAGNDKESGRKSHLAVEAALGCSRKLAGGQIMFLAGSYRIGLARLEHRISGVGMRLDGSSQSTSATSSRYMFWHTRVSGAASMM